VGRRTLLLVAALVVAALGTLLIFAYVRNADDRALEDQEPVEVLVAKTLIRAGTLGSEAEKQGTFKLQRIPRAATIPGVLSDTRPIQKLVAVSDIYPGEQIIVNKFAASGSTSALNIPTGDVAMSVTMGDPQRVAGFVRPGSEIVVFFSTEINGVKGTTVLLPKMTVLAVGPTTLQTTAGGGPANKEALPTAIITLAANQIEAQKLIYALQNGQLYFGLLDEESVIVKGPVVNETNLFK
jgi:pilus assembly protein CpaB